jgi:hypothetical protein
MGPVWRHRGSGIKRDFFLLKWMAGFVLALQLATLIKLFTQ